MNLGWPFLSNSQQIAVFHFRSHVTPGLLRFFFSLHCKGYKTYCKIPKGTIPVNTRVAGVWFVCLFAVWFVCEMPKYSPDPFIISVAGTTNRHDNNRLPAGWRVLHAGFSLFLSSLRKCQNIGAGARGGGGGGGRVKQTSTSRSVEKKKSHHLRNKV